MLSILPFYAIKINNEKTNAKILNMSWSVPVLLFCHSPYCSICQGIHPAWHKLNEKYKNDPKVIVSEIDCNYQESICLNYYHTKGFPTFKKILKGYPYKISPGHDFDSLNSIVSSLKDLKMDELCKNFPDNDDQKYPAFVVSSPETRSKVCSSIDDLIGDDRSLVPYVYGKYNQSENAIDVYMDETTHVRMKKEITTDNVREFMNEYRLPNFGLTKWNDVMQRKRTIAIILLENPSDVKYFVSIGNNNSEKYYWTSVTIKKFNEMSGLNIKESPSLVVTHPTKKKMCIYKSIAAENVLEKLEEKNWCNTGEVINKRASKVFHDVVLFPGLSKNARYFIIGIVIVVVAFFVISIFNVLYDPTPKFE